MKNLIDNDETSPLSLTRWKDQCGRYFYDVRINEQFITTIPATSFSKKVRDSLVKAYFTGVHQSIEGLVKTAASVKQIYLEKK
jgi:hypothetical protein